MASDQRYCLECGTRRSGLGASPVDHCLGGAPVDRLRVSAASALAPASAGSGAPRGERPGGAHAAQARPNGTPAVIAGVGVLLLAMGVGVLIGHSAATSSGRAGSAPAQVISVASPGAGTSVPTTSTPSSTTPPAQSPAHKPGKSSSGVGSTPGKPAPPATLQNLRTGGSGQSYEQKSKNLPNVVSTG
jgi:hypothetical protein